MFAAGFDDVLPHERRSPTTSGAYDAASSKDVCRSNAAGLPRRSVRRDGGRQRTPLQRSTNV